MVILTTDPLSAVPVNVGVVSLVAYGDVVSHHTLVTVGLLGALVSKATNTVPVALFHAGSVIVTVGLLLNNVPLHITAQPVLGFGVHISPGIDVVAPLSTGVRVIVTAPLVGFGFTV